VVMMYATVQLLRVETRGIQCHAVMMKEEASNVQGEQVRKQMYNVTVVARAARSSGCKAKF
jgi:hypothetical protein